MIVISACLGGIACRYDGNDNLISKIEELLQKEDTVLICPEVLGGLPTPRPSAEIIGGNGDDVLDGKAKVMTKDGEDVTESFVGGAYKALEQIKNLHPEYIILKERSPSCGSSTIYTGEFNGNKQTGYGVTTALFKRHGFTVISEEDFENQKKELTLFVNSFFLSYFAPNFSFTFAGSSSFFTSSQAVTPFLSELYTRKNASLRRFF